MAEKSWCFLSFLSPPSFFFKQVSRLTENCTHTKHTGSVLVEGNTLDRTAVIHSACLSQNIKAILPDKDRYLALWPDSKHWAAVGQHPVSVCTASHCDLTAHNSLVQKNTLLVVCRWSCQGQSYWFSPPPFSLFCFWPPWLECIFAVHGAMVFAYRDLSWKKPLVHSWFYAACHHHQNSHATSLSKQPHYIIIKTAMLHHHQNSHATSSSK